MWEGGQTARRVRHLRARGPAWAAGDKGETHEQEEARSPRDRERQRDPLGSEPRKENRHGGEEHDRRCDFGDRPVPRMAEAVDPVRENASARHEERREEEDLSDRGRFGEVLPEQERDELARHELERHDDQSRQREPEEEKSPHGAACRLAIALGGDLRIRNHPDARRNHTRQQRERLSNDVVTERHRAQEKADDSLVEANNIDRGQTSQQGLEPELQHLPARRVGLLSARLGSPRTAKARAKNPPIRLTAAHSAMNRTRLVAFSA